MNGHAQGLSLGITALTLAVELYHVRHAEALEIKPAFMSRLAAAKDIRRHPVEVWDSMGSV